MPTTDVFAIRRKIIGVLLNSIDLRRTDGEFYRYYHAYHKSDVDKQP